MTVQSLTVDELTAPLSRQDVQASIYRVLAKVGVDTSAWKSGGPTRTMIVGVSAIIAAMSKHQAQVARSGWLELAADQWLDLSAYFVYAQRRIAATYGTGTLTLVNTGGGVYALDPGDLIVTNPATKQSYRNASAISLGSGATVSGVSFIAVEPGSAASADAGAITELTTVLPGVQIASGSSSRVVGLDRESDAALRARCAARLGALSPMGPWDAYAYAARNAVRADGSSVGVTRIRLTKDGYGHVTVYVAKQAGAIPPADLAIVADAIDRNAVPQAITAFVVSAAEHPIAVGVTVYAYNTSGRTETQVQDLVRAQLRSFMDAQPVGGNVIAGVGRVYADAIRVAAARAIPEIIHVTLTAPSGDVTLTVNEVPTLGASSVGVVFVPPSEGYGA